LFLTNDSRKDAGGFEQVLSCRQAGIPERHSMAPANRTARSKWERNKGSFLGESFVRGLMYIF
jgi:hypothetical protein